LGVEEEKTGNHEESGDGKAGERVYGYGKPPSGGADLIKLVGWRGGNVDDDNGDNGYGSDKIEVFYFVFGHGLISDFNILID